MEQARADTVRSGPAEIVSIQYLRGFAALAVLVTHALQWPLPAMNLGLLKTGRLGVDVFFVISGFIITMIGGSGRFDPKTFLARRALRIVPIYWVATLLVTVLALALSSHFRTTVPTLQGFVESLLFIPSSTPKAPLLGVGWTLDYEIFFYLVFAALCFLKSEARTFVLCAVFVLLIALGQSAAHPGMLQYFYTSPSLLGFTLGTLLALAWRRGLIARFNAKARTAVFLALPVLLAGYYLTALPDPDHAPLIFHLALSASAVCIVLIGLEMEARARLPRAGVCKYLGDASYSIYLFHLFPLGAMWAIANRILPAMQTPAYLGVATVVIAVSLAFGLAAHRLLEAPLLEVAKKGRKRPRPEMPEVVPAVLRDLRASA
jgi:exopolysaccharide production protein ExoZ